MPPSLRSMLSILSTRHKRTREATRLIRRGAAIVDPAAWDEAWNKAMPADSFTSTSFTKE